MTIKDFVNYIGKNAANHKFVHNFQEGDVYEIMNNGENKYASIILTINNIQTTLEQTRLNCYLFYIDRLVEDDKNRLDIWATGSAVLHKIIYMSGYNNFDIIANQDIVYQPLRKSFRIYALEFMQMLILIY